MHLSSFQKYNVNNSVVVRFCPDVGVYVSESGLQNFASPMIWKYIPNMDVKEISKALFWFSYENIDPLYSLKHCPYCERFICLNYSEEKVSLCENIQ